MRGVKAMLGVAVLGGLMFAGSVALGASPPAGGPVRVFVKQGNGATGTILITGAIGDYGRTVSIDKNGKPDSNGNYAKVILTKGSFEVNKTALDNKINHAKPAVNSTTCSFSFGATGPISLLNGTGLYQGISGTVNITATFALVAPRYASGKNKGKCNESMNARPLAQYTSISGSGTVRFS